MTALLVSTVSCILKQYLSGGERIQPPAGQERVATLLAESDPDSQEAPFRQPERRHTEWLRNTLVVSGPTEAAMRFRTVAAGSGMIPWELDLAAVEEEFLLPMAAPGDGVRAMSLPGARLLARRLREAVALNHQRAFYRIDTDRSCPLNLHRLLPVPAALLRLGPEEEASRDWLLTHWGTTRPLRQVEELASTMDRHKMAKLRVGFWSADWSPWQAVVRLRRDWPELSFVLRPGGGTRQQREAGESCRAGRPRRHLPAPAGGGL